MKNYAIILAGGTGKRLGSKVPKCFIKIDGIEMYRFSLETFLSIKKFKKIVLVVPNGYQDKIKVKDKRLLIQTGGQTRNSSFEKGMEVLKNYLKPYDKIYIHDAARPFVNKKDIKALIKSNLHYGTLAYIGSKNKSDYHIGKYNVQTPQFTRYWVYESLKSKNRAGKDLISYFRLKPSAENFIISSNKDKNFKVTFKADLQLLK